MTNQRQKALLMLILSLVLLKWLAVPVMEGVEEKLTAQALLKRSIHKMEQLLEQEQQWRDVETTATEARAKAFGELTLYDSPEAFQLAAQQQLEAMLAEFQISSERFTWEPPQLALEQASIYQQRASIKASGDTYQLLALLAHLDKQAPLFNSTNMSMDIHTGQGLGTMNLFLGIDAFYMLREVN
ncbi:hypothetical protein [Rheinheimera sp.]|uniref:hypothetical protein n=1 Tax=Rheinheimera sp. TaxID=1869214 RepID=UPI00307E6CC5